MKTLDLNELLQNHPYPGRGIVLGRSADGRSGHHLLHHGPQREQP